jgi:hypothetical protein
MDGVPLFIYRGCDVTFLPAPFDSHTRQPSQANDSPPPPSPQPGAAARARSPRPLVAPVASGLFPSSAKSAPGTHRADIAMANKTIAALSMTRGAAVVTLNCLRLTCNLVFFNHLLCYFQYYSFLKQGEMSKKWFLI